MMQIEFYWMLEEFTEYSSLPRFDCPKNDNELLLNLQYDFLINNSKEAEERLWVKSINLAEAFIRKEMKKKGFFLSRDDIEDKKLDAVEYVLRRFKGKKRYYVKESFTSTIYFGVEHALYHRNMAQVLMDECIERMNENKALTLQDTLEDIKARRARRKAKAHSLQLELPFF